MFNRIDSKELPTWVQILSDQGKDAQEILADLTLIDDLLVLQKMQSLLTRKKGLTMQLDNRIAVEVGLTHKNMN